MKRKYELQQEIDAKNQRLADLFKAGGDNLDLNDDQVNEIRQLNAEVSDLGKQRDAAAELEAIEAQTKQRAQQRSSDRAQDASVQPGRAQEQEQPRVKSIAERFYE